MLPFSGRQIYDLAADVERYPEFMQWWIAARITRREPNKLWVEQTLGFGPMHLQFDSEAVLNPPERIDVISSNPMFRRFSLAFQVEARTPVSCKLCIEAQLELRARILGYAVDAVLGNSIGDIIGAFESRAHRLYDRTM